MICYDKAMQLDPSTKENIEPIDKAEKLKRIKSCTSDGKPVYE
jgi:hypothetical protein